MRVVAFVFSWLAIFVLCAKAEADKSLADARLGPLKDLNGYFPFEAPATAALWEKRAEEVRRRVLVSQGLWPMPKKTLLRPVIHGRMTFGDYLVEKVYFESFPGFYVTGNLYRPMGRWGLSPGVLCPHGHWAKGRFMDNENVRKEIAQGAERFEEGGRSPLQSRCAQLARMGCTVFHYDMIGYGDSVQIGYELAHRFARQRPEMNRRQDWGLFSPQAESHLQSVMGLQTWNSIRALDFLETLPEVDKQRLAATGASGGGTQTFMLAAVDARLAAAFPAVMVSTAMQGGCVCENACLLRIGTGNVEIAALFAPKPLGLTGANDWTAEMSSKGFPELRALYRLLGREENVMLKALNHFGHNYNYVSRTAMYHWFNRHLRLGLAEPILEKDYPYLSQAELTVWNAAHPQPQGGDDFERNLLRHWLEDGRRQLLALAERPQVFAELTAPAIGVVLGRTLESAGNVIWEERRKVERGSHLEISGLLRNTTYGEALPAVFFQPKERQGATVIWLSTLGKAGLRDDEGRLRPWTQKLLDDGATVVGADLLRQGEFLADERPLQRTRRVKNPREAAAYTFGYNHAVFARRTHDVLTIIQFLKTQNTQKIVLAGLDGAGHWAAAARSVCGDAVQKYAIDTGGFRFGAVEDVHDPDFLPGGAKYLDLPGFLLLGDAQPLWLAGESTQTQEWLQNRYAKADADDNLTFPEPSQTSANAAADWILKGLSGRNEETSQD